MPFTVSHLPMYLKILLPLLLCFHFTASAQFIPQLLFNLKDTEPLKMSLFDSDTLTEFGEVLWRPTTFEDRLRAETSDDGYFHTELDTILYFSTYGIKRAVAIFATYNYQKGQLNACPNCAAMLSVATFDETVSGQWQIELFAKHFTSLGSNGENGLVGITQFGENQWCLRLEMGWTGSHTYSEQVSFWDLENLDRVFSYISHEDNGATANIDSEKAYSFDRTMHFVNLEEDSKSSAWWEFDLVSRGSRIDEADDRAVPANVVQRYAFDWEASMYRRVCE